jgi:hypothetical protein
MVTNSMSWARLHKQANVMIKLSLRLDLALLSGGDLEHHLCKKTVKSILAHFLARKEPYTLPHGDTYGNSYQVHIPVVTQIEGRKPWAFRVGPLVSRPLRTCLFGLSMVNCAEKADVHEKPTTKAIQFWFFWMTIFLKI